MKTSLDQYFGQKFYLKSFFWKILSFFLHMLTP